jgi:methyltransferase (TIGR00027 family)
MPSGGPSRTAQQVAAHRLECTRLDVGFGRATDDDLLARDVAGALAIRREGMHRYLLARTAFFDRCVVTAIRRGIDQVVVLGAGYDGRSLRYARGGVSFFEVDLAATQADKRERLGRLGVDATGVTFVPADFSHDDVGARLVAAGLGPSATLFLLEGVVPYLDDETLRSLLVSVARLAPKGSSMAISVGITHDDDRDASGQVESFRATVAALGEPVRSTLSASTARELLSACGWSVHESDDGDGSDVATEQRLGLLVVAAR